MLQLRSLYHSRVTKKLFGSTLAVLLLVSTVCAQSRKVQSDTKFNFQAKNRLRIENPRGNISINVSSRNSIEVTALRHASPEPPVQAEELKIDQSSNQISIKTIPVTNGIDLKVAVPEGTNLLLSTEMGDIELSGNTTAVIASTRSGNIWINLPETANCNLALTSASGKIRSTRLVSASNSQSYHGQLGNGGDIISVHTERGDIVVQSQISNKDLVKNIPDSSTKENSSNREKREGARTEPTFSKDSIANPSVSNPTSKPVLKRTEDSTATSETPSEQSDDGDNVLRIETKLVTLNASATKATGQPLPDLSKDDFLLFEDGVQQDIVHFQSTRTPFNLVLLIDLSGSVKEKMKLIKRSAWFFVQATRPEDKVAIVTFTDSAKLVCPLTNDRELLKERINNIKNPDSGTNFYDALYDTVEWLLRKAKGERNAIVIMSDGVDNALPGVPGRGSETPFDSLFDKIQEAEVLIFPVYLNTEQEVENMYDMDFRQAYATSRKQMRGLAEATGGSIFYAERVEDLQGCYEQVAAELRTIYSLGYYPTNSNQDGSFRKIKLQIKQDDARVRTRRGYYAKESRMESRK